jgi:PhnB protein
MAVEGSIPAAGVIVPHLVVADAALAVEFYIRAFAAEILYRSPSPSGHGEHIHLRIWSSLVQVSTEEPAQRRSKVEGSLLASPETLHGSTCVFQIGVPDVDALYRRAVDNGAVPVLPPMDMFWGDRYGWVKDPFGHVWAFCTVKEILTARQIDERLRDLTRQTTGQSS